jgi:hypothetical protein
MRREPRCSQRNMLRAARTQFPKHVVYSCVTVFSHAQAAKAARVGARKHNRRGLACQFRRAGTRVSRLR